MQKEPKTAKGGERKRLQEINGDSAHKRTVWT